MGWSDGLGEAALLRRLVANGCGDAAGGQCRKRVQLVVERLAAAMEPVEQRLHPGIDVGPVGVRHDVVAKRHRCLDRLGKAAVAPHRGLGYRGATDDAAFGLRGHQDGHAVDAGLDPEPQVGFRPAAGGDHPLHAPPDRGLHDAEVTGGGERNAFENGSLQFRPAMRGVKPEELGACVAPADDGLLGPAERRYDLLLLDGGCSRRGRTSSG